MGKDTYVPSEFKLFHHPEIAELRQPLQALVNKILPELRSLKYSAIISDDLSGRIPATVIWNIAKQIYGKNNRIIPMLKIRGSKPFSQIQDTLDVRKNTQTDKDLFRLQPILSGLSKEQKVLIVTEYIESGATIQNLTEQMSSIGLESDVASATVNSNFKNIDLLPKNSIIFSGKTVEGKPKVWGLYELQGTDQNRQEKLSPVSPTLADDINQLTEQIQDNIIE